jgi:hypothetical protein
MQDIIYKYEIAKCSNLKYWVMHRGLPLLVGLESGMSISSELWFGASVNSLVTFT